jgi:RND superfamily putative drug exporter
MFSLLGRLATTHPWKVLATWLVLGVLLSAIAPNWASQAQDDDVRFLPPATPSVRAHALMSEAFPQDVSASRAVFAVERPDAPLTPADFARVDALVAELKRLDAAEPGLRIRSVASFRDPVTGPRLISHDRHCTLVQLALETPYLAAQTAAAVDRAERAARAVFPADDGSGLRVVVTGPAGVGRDLVRASEQSLDRTTLATVLLIVAVLLLIYRSPSLALVPLVTIGVAVWVSLKLLALVTLIPGVQLVNISQVFAVVILFGAGTDYCLFLISRYREELVAGETNRVALQRGVRSVGGALAASAATVIVGLGMMGFAEFGKIRCAGPVIALGLAVALLASLTLTPALLRLLGRAAFWPFRVVPRPAGESSRGVWWWIADLVTKRPVLVWSLALAPLLPLAFLGMQVSPTFKPVGDLGPGAPSVLGLDVIQKRFCAGETGPVTVLLDSSANWDGPGGRELVARLSRGFGHLENVAEVRSLTQPLGVPLEPRPVAAAAPAGGGWGAWAQSLQHNLGGLVDRATERAAAGHYVAAVDCTAGPRSVTRIDVCLKTDPFDPASVATLEVIEEWLRTLLPEDAAGTPFAGARAEVFGVTANSRDLAAVIASDRVRVNTLVLGGVFLILLALVRRLWLSGYLLGTVVLSYYATLGATALFATWTTGRPLGQIEWRVPFFLFTILVAVGEDYNILMVTRVFQERKRLGPTEGLRRGLATTGGTVTACGLIMAGTFGTLMLADLSTLTQIGFALAFGVVMDTLVVRALLVPSFMLLVWRERQQYEAAIAVQRPRRELALRRVG